MGYQTSRTNVLKPKKKGTIEMVNITSLSENCVLVGLHCRYWRGIRQDKRAEKAVEREFSTMGDAGRYSKRVISADDISPVLTVISQARTYLDGLSLPWQDGGYRIIPTAIYLDVAAEMRGLRGQFDQAVEGFLARYQSMRAAAEIRLGNLFSPDDFPPIEQVRRKFAFGLETTPVAVDWRVNLSDSAVADLQAQTETMVAERIESATLALIERLRDVISRAAEKLGGGGVFRDSLLGNIQDVVAVLPKLNIAQDARIDGLIRSLERSVLTQSEPDDFRKDATIRQVGADHAKALLDKLDKMLGKGA